MKTYHNKPLYKVGSLSGGGSKLTKSARLTKKDYIPNGFLGRVPSCRQRCPAGKTLPARLPGSTTVSSPACPSPPLRQQLPTPLETKTARSRFYATASPAAQPAPSPRCCEAEPGPHLLLAGGGETSPHVPLPTGRRARRRRRSSQNGGGPTPAAAGELPAEARSRCHRPSAAGERWESSRESAPGTGRAQGKRAKAQRLPAAREGAARPALTGGRAG